MEPKFGKITCGRKNLGENINFSLGGPTTWDTPMRMVCDENDLKLSVYFIHRELTAMDPTYFGRTSNNAEPPSTITTEQSTDTNTRHHGTADDPYDYRNVTASSSFPSLDDSPEFKMFFLDVVLKDGKVSRTFPTRIAKRESAKIYEKISKLALMEMGAFEVVYEVLRHSGKRETQKLHFNPDAEIMAEGCELLFCQVRSESHLTVQRVSKVCVRKKSRKSKHIEKTCTEFKKCLGTKNRKAYQLLAEDQDIIEKYLEKLTFIRVLLSDLTCNNWLSPAHFYCPLKTCQRKEITMNSFNSLHNLQKHLVNHDLQKNKMCSVLIDRMKFMSRNDWFSSNIDKGMDWMIQALEEKPDLALSAYEITTVHLGNNFKGSSKCLDPVILQEFLNNNFESLKKIKDSRTVRSMFCNVSSESANELDGCNNDEDDSITDEVLEREVEGDEEEDENRNKEKEKEDEEDEEEDEEDEEE